MANPSGDSTRKRAINGYGFLALFSGSYLVLLLGLYLRGDIEIGERFNLLPTAWALPAMLLIFAGGLRRYQRWGWYAGLAGVAILLGLVPIGTILGFYGLSVLFRPQLTRCIDAGKNHLLLLESKLPFAFPRELLRTIGIFAVFWCFFLIVSSSSSLGGATGRAYLTVVGPLWAVAYLSLLLAPWVRRRTTATLILAVVGSWAMWIASSVLGGYFYYPPEFKLTPAQNEMQMFRGALYRYRNDVGDHRYPATLTQLTQDTASGWAGPYLATIKPDPWGNQYQFNSDGAEYTLQTTGRSGMRYYRVITRASEPVILTFPVEEETK